MRHLRATGGLIVLGAIVLAGGEGGVNSSHADGMARDTGVPHADAGIAAHRSFVAQPDSSPAQPDPPVAARDALRGHASPGELAILDRLARIERGMFRRDSTLPRSDADSIEQRIEDLAGRVAVGHPPLADDAGTLRDIKGAIDQLDRDVEREVADVLERLERTIVEMDRRATRESDLVRRLDDLARAVERVDRRLESIERRIR